MIHERTAQPEKQLRGKYSYLFSVRCSEGASVGRPVCISALVRDSTLVPK